MAYKETVVYKSVNHLLLKADIYNVEQKQSPIILFLHGGALIWGSRDDIVKEQVKFYNDLGFTVISVDYRLAPENKLFEIIEDIKDCIDWIKSEAYKTYDLDPNELIVVGSSAGGYLALMTGTFNNKPKSIISFYGYCDILASWYRKPSEFYCLRPTVSKDEAYSLIGTKPISEGDTNRMKYYLYCRQNGIWTEEVSGYENDSKLKEACPYCLAMKDFPKTLLIHGNKDTDVPYEQSVLMADKLKSLNVKHKLILVSDKGHVFDYNMDSVVEKVFHEVKQFIVNGSE